MPRLEPKLFVGYSPPGSNTTYTPNQFFDVVLPNSSRGVVRIVGYMLRKILGWSDAQGNPVQSQVSFTYSDLINQANVSRAMIKDALDEAIEKRFILCVREPRPKLSGQSAVSGVYELRWSDDSTYVKDIEEFRGFYSGNGNLTNIPNDFFDYTLREEPLSVIRVVGAIARHTIGFQTSYGFRRQQVQASMTRLHQLTGITSRDLLSEAIQESITRQHIVRVVQGRFDTSSSKESIASVYALRWQDGHSDRSTDLISNQSQKKFAEIASDRKGPAVGQQTQDVDRPAPSIRKPVREKGGEEALLDATIGLRTGPREASPSSGTVRNTDRAATRHRFENRTDIGSNSEPGTVRKEVRERFENRTDIEITGEITPNNNSKSVVSGYELLLKAGFEQRVAKNLASRFDEARIARQLELLPKRKPSKNPLGLLRRAIEEDWAPPLTVKPSDESLQPHTSDGNFNALYEEFLQNEASALKAADSEFRFQFDAKERALRTTLADSSMISAGIKERLLREFDEESQQSKRWIEFALLKKKLPSMAYWQSRLAKRE